MFSFFFLIFVFFFRFFLSVGDIVLLRELVIVIIAYNELTIDTICCNSSSRLTVSIH